MTKILSLSFAVAFSLLSVCAPAQEGTAPPQDPKPAPVQEPTAEPTPAEAAARFLAQFRPETGTVKIGDYGTVALAEGWQWLAGRNGQRFLVELGNFNDPSVRGVALPPDYAETMVFAVYSHSDEGHVDDAEPDYAELLQSMKDGEEANNEERRKAGIATVNLLGWAEPPHYDKAGHKLYWAKKLQFEGSPTPTVNYDVRILGRTGCIEVVGVGDIEQLPIVAQRCKELLTATEFVDGQRYSDFDPAYDKVAAYGIGGLIAGKLALKAGLFAKLGILLVKFLKPILVGVALLGGLLFKVVGAKKRERAAIAADGGGSRDDA
jgi:uncharacterized membrane-anchored protein